MICLSMETTTSLFMVPILVDVMYVVKFTLHVPPDPFCTKPSLIEARMMAYAVRLVYVA